MVGKSPAQPDHELLNLTKLLERALEEAKLRPIPDEQAINQLNAEYQRLQQNVKQLELEKQIAPLEKAMRAQSIGIRVYSILANIVTAAGTLLKKVAHIIPPLQLVLLGGIRLLEVYKLLKQKAQIPKWALISKIGFALTTLGLAIAAAVTPVGVGLILTAVAAGIGFVKEALDLYRIHQKIHNCEKYLANKAAILTKIINHPDKIIAHQAELSYHVQDFAYHKNELARLKKSRFLNEGTDFALAVCSIVAAIIMCFFPPVGAGILIAAACIALVVKFNVIDHLCNAWKTFEKKFTDLFKSSKNQTNNSQLYYLFNLNQRPEAPPASLNAPKPATYDYAIKNYILRLTEGIAPKPKQQIFIEDENNKTAESKLNKPNLH